MNWQQFVVDSRKFLVALLAGLTILGVALVDNTVTKSEWVQIAVAFVGALGVYRLPNGSSNE